VIHDKGMSKDGGPMETVPCDAEIGGVTFGFIQLDEKTTAELNCVDDYAGGISIVIKGAKGSAASEKLGEVLGDAGESTETRSWITKKEGHINIQTVTYSSYQDPDAEDTAPVNCEKKAWSIDFDKKSKKFKRKSIALNEKDMKFVPAARVAEKCAL
jgi:preprotein translocase subunit SecF